jgi:carbamoyltransferase
MTRTFVLGTGLSHSGSVCLLADGVPVAAIEKERLTRVKRDGGNDRAAMQYVLDSAGITLADVDVVVQNENFGMFRDGNATYAREPRLLTGDTAVVTISHHLAHAYSAFGPAPFDDCSVLVLDGCGNAYEDCIDVEPGVVLEPVPDKLGHIFFEKDSFYRASGGHLRTVAKDFSSWGPRGLPLAPPTTLDSIGGLYQVFSEYVFGRFEDAGKLMGLAPYGRLGQFDGQLFKLEEGRIFVRRDALPQFGQPSRSRSDFKTRFQYFADLARWVQAELERALMYLIDDRLSRAPSRNLAYAGGVALNAVANARILREVGVDELYVQPAAGDNGLAVGCAYYGWLRVLGRERVLARSSEPVFFGRSYSGTRVEAAVAAVGNQVEEIRPTCPEALAARTAELLAAGRIVGWFQDGSELGPRALGHRSILAHPGIDGLRDKINRQIKFREDFRPFAPSVLAERAEEYFETGGHESPYMILVFATKPDKRPYLANVTHVDYSARVQTVRQDCTPEYHRLIAAFGDLTGLPILLNTSLNKRGMPIVETPEEAVALFLEGDLDVLVLNDRILTKTAESSGLNAGIRRGGVSDPVAQDVPLPGLRIRRYALVHDLGVPSSRAMHAPGTAFGVVDLLDRPNQLRLDASMYQLLSNCDGLRTYREIASELGLKIEDILRLGGRLAEAGLVDHRLLDPE